MGSLLERYGKIDLAKLLKVDLHQMTLLPFIMVMTSVFHASISFNAHELQTVSYAFLFMDLMSALFITIIYFRRKKITWFVFLVFLYCISFLFSTIINGNDIKRSIYDGCSIMFIVMVCDYYQYRFNFVISSFAIAFSFCAYLNFIFLLTHPELWFVEELKAGSGYLLGSNYNQMGSRLLCAVATSICCQRYNKWWLVNSILVTLVSLVSLSFVGSKTSMTGITLFVLFTLIPSHRWIKLIIITLIISVVLFQVLVCFQGHGLESNKLATYFIEDVLQKDVTFSNRIYLWSAAEKLFMNSPIYGHGAASADWYTSYLSSKGLGPHNFIWYILITGGVILLAVFTIICLLSATKFINATNRSVLSLFAAIAIMFLMMTMEVYPRQLIFCMLSLAYFAENSRRHVSVNGS